MTIGTKCRVIAQLQGRMSENVFNMPVEDYVENRETAHVSTSTHNSSASCTQVSALVEDFIRFRVYLAAYHL